MATSDEKQPETKWNQKMAMEADWAYFVTSASLYAAGLKVEFEGISHLEIPKQTWKGTNQIEASMDVVVAFSTRNSTFRYNT